MLREEVLAIGVLASAMLVAGSGCGSNRNCLGGSCAGPPYGAPSQGGYAPSVAPSPSDQYAPNAASSPSQGYVPGAAPAPSQGGYAPSPVPNSGPGASPGYSAPSGGGAAPQPAPGSQGFDPADGAP